MKVEDCLTGVRSVVDGDPVAAVEQTFLCCDLPSEKEKAASQIRIVWAEIAECGDMDSRDDEHMRGRLGREIAECHRGVTLGDKLRPELTADYSAKDAVRIARVFHPHLPMQ